MKKTASCLILIFMAAATFAQENMKAYVTQNIKRVNSISPDNDDYADLEAFGNAILGKRIVMLGELDHGDGTCFSAKSRLVKYLHEKHNFNVIAFESDFYGVNAGWEKFMEDKMQLDSLVGQSIFGVWTTCKQSQETFKYIYQQSQTNQKLKLAGFDNQLVSAYSFLHLGQDLKVFLDSSNIPFTKAPAYATFFQQVRRIRFLKGEAAIKIADSLILYTRQVLRELKDEYPSTHFKIQVIESLLSQCLQFRANWVNNDVNYYEAKGIRDAGMGENMKWVANTLYPKEKIIVWAHNSHILKNGDTVVNRKTYTPFSMGYHFTRDTALLDQTYILGFTSLNGESKFATMDKVVPVIPVRKNSIESWIKKTGYQYAYIDLRNACDSSRFSDESYSMRTMPNAQAIAAWHKAYDGLFYIETMEPCIRDLTIND